MTDVLQPPPIPENIAGDKKVTVTWLRWFELLKNRIGTKIDKVEDGVEDNIVTLDENGNAQDSGMDISTVLNPGDIYGTDYQITVTNGTEAVTLSLPDDVAINNTLTVPNVYGSKVSGGSLTLESTIHATKGQIIIKDDILLYKTEYLLTTCGGKCLTVQQIDSGQLSHLRLMSADGDGTDHVIFSIHGVGTPDDVINRERLLLGWDKTHSDYHISVDANGTGTLRKLHFGNTTYPHMVCINADGTVDLGDDDTGNYTSINQAGELSFKGTSRIAWTKIAANGVTLGDGPPTSSDTVADLQTAHDGNTYTVDEAAANAGQNLIVDFTGVTAFNWVQILFYYDGQATHELHVQLEVAPFDDSTWHDYRCAIPNHGFKEDYSFFVPDDSVYINSGVVKVRFIHPDSGNSNDDWVFDVVALYQ